MLACVLLLITVLNVPELIALSISFLDHQRLGKGLGIL